MDPGLRRSDEMLAHGRAIHRRERRRLRHITDGELVLTGGSCVPGALTVGDVDLHLRVAAADFGDVVERLRGLYEIVHPDIWTATLATFVVRGEDVGIAVTPIGSEHDRRFTVAWNRLRSEPELLEAYNAMKRKHAGRGDEAYREAKSRFFDEIVATAERPLATRS